MRDSPQGTSRVWFGREGGWRWPLEAEMSSSPWWPLGGPLRTCPLLVPPGARRLGLPQLKAGGEMEQEGKALRDGLGEACGLPVGMPPRSSDQDLSSWVIFIPTPSQVCGP